MTTLFVICIILIALSLGLAFYFYRNINYDDWQKNKVFRSGFHEHQVMLPSGMVLNYGEGPSLGEPLLLIHGQGTDWTDYAKVLPRLSKKFHIYAVDCPGHGKSGRITDGYTAEKIGADLLWFIEQVIGQATYISGHSSGGLLTAWLAAHASDQIKGIVLEDPPLFSSEKGRYEATYAWVDSFRLIHEFHQQDDESDYLIYYLKNSYWKDKFGKLWDVILKRALAFRAKNPLGIFNVFFLPPSINQIWEIASNENYDKQFGEAFYDGSWFVNFDHAEIVSRIDCPSILIYAKNSKWKPYDENGILLGAMSDQDAERSHGLIRGNRLVTMDSGHRVHGEKPKEFVEIMQAILSATCNAPQGT